MKAIEEMRQMGERRKKGGYVTDSKNDCLFTDKVREESIRVLERMECKAKVVLEKEALEKSVKELTEEIMKEMKGEIKRWDEEIKDQREEIESLKRKVRRLEQGVGAGKRKRDDSEESRNRLEKRKWWAEDGERNDDERRKKNIIIRLEKNKWMEKETNWEKVKELFTEGLKVKVDVKEVCVIGQRGKWVTVLVRLGSEEDKWRVLEAKRRK